MSTYKPNARGDLPGPGDFSPSDPEELPEIYLDEARELLTADDEAETPPTEDEITACAWELYEAAKKQAEYDAGEDAYERQKDREAGLE